MYRHFYEIYRMEHSKGKITEEIFLLRDEASLKNTLLFEALVSEVNALLDRDFEKLVSLLYRLDIPEARLRGLLANNPGTDAARIIAEMIIERQLEKIRSRQENRRDENIAEEDKW